MTLEDLRAEEYEVNGTTFYFEKMPVMEAFGITEGIREELAQLKGSEDLFKMEEGRIVQERGRG